MIKAILFDLDGVLMNSEVTENKWAIEWAKINNFNLQLKDFDMLVGSSDQMNLFKEIYKLANTDISYESFKNSFENHKKAKRNSFDYSSIRFNDVKPFLNFCRKLNLRIACVSSSHYDYIVNALTKMDILKYFEVITSGEYFKESKPNPEIYNHTIEKMHLKSQDCLVIEDSLFGIRAGKAANCIVAARRDCNFNINQSDADYIFDNLSELPFYFNLYDSQYNNPIIKNIIERRSIRKFNNTPISNDDLEVIANCAIHAPSGSCRDTWYFAIINNRDLINECINLLKTEMHNENYTMYNPTALIIPANRKDNHHNKEDNCCALENIFLSAKALGIGSVWINQLRHYTDNKNIRVFLEKIGINQEMEVFGIAALGYYDEEPVEIQRKGKWHIYN